MVPRLLYRWKSFWFGILVLVFLGWSWVRSMDNLDELRFSMAGGAWGILCTMGKIAVRWSESVNTGIGIRDIHFTSEPGGGFDREIPPAFERLGMEEAGAETWMFALWFLMLLFFVPWSGFLCWRWRMQKKAADSIASSPPETGCQSENA